MCEIGLKFLGSALLSPSWIRFRKICPSFAMLQIYHGSGNPSRLYAGGRKGIALVGWRGNPSGPADFVRFSLSIAFSISS